jgi:hypothetical protein
MNRYKWSINGYYDYPLDEALDIEADTAEITPNAGQLLILTPFSYE